MNKKSVIILWVIATALGISVAILSSKKSDSGKANTARARGETLLASFPGANVSKLVISSATNTVTMEKKGNDWSIAERENYPAKITNINALIRAIGEVKINNAIEAGPSYAKRFGVDVEAKVAEQHGRLIEMSDASGKNIASIVIGKESESGGLFIRNMADETGIYVTNEPFPTATAEAKDWLDDEFIKVEKITSVGISPAGKPEETEWKLTRSDENAEFTLDGLKAGETINATNTSAIKSLLGYARFQDVISKSKIEAHQKAADLRKLTISTKDGFTYTVMLSAKPNEAPPAALANSQESSAPPEDAYLMTVAVSAEIKKERQKEKDEKPEDAKVKDEAHAAAVKKLEEKLATEKAYEGQLYEVSKYVIDAVLKPRSEFITQAPAVGETPPAGQNPGRIEATTPPISIDGTGIGQ